MLKGHRDWFGASLLFHNDKLISCAPRSLSEKMEIKKLGFGSQWTGYRNMKENTGAKNYEYKIKLPITVIKSEIHLKCSNLTN